MYFDDTNKQWISTGSDVMKFCMKFKDEIIRYGKDVILCVVFKGVTYMFQLEDTTNILSEGSVILMEGTLFEFLEEEPCEEIDYFPISNCRFPTKEELEWYNKIDTV